MERTCLCGCGKSMVGKRPHAKWYGDACRERAKRLRLYGPPKPVGRPRKKGPLYRINPETGCWDWLMGRQARGSGYGVINRDGRSWAAHVWMYEQLVAPVPVGCELHHGCENKGCVNVLDPRHIRPVTRAAHMRIHAKVTPELIRLCVGMQNQAIADLIGVSVSSIYRTKRLMREGRI